jgi:hypothetical protein
MSDKVTRTAYVLVWNLNSRGEPFASLFAPDQYLAPKEGEPANLAVIPIEPTPGKVMPPLRELAIAHRPEGYPYKAPVPPMPADIA